MHSLEPQEAICMGSGRGEKNIEVPLRHKSRLNRAEEKKFELEENDWGSCPASESTGCL